MTEQPGLFDLPAPPTPPPVPPSGHGRTRETWSRTVTAEITVVDRRALRDAALRRLEEGIAIGEFADDDPDLTDPREDVARSCAAAVQWCLEPPEGLWPLQEAGAGRIDQVELAATDQEPGRVRASWTVTVRITDAGFAATWNRAANPHSPMHHIPGITWTPAGVAITHLVHRSTQDAE